MKNRIFLFIFSLFFCFSFFSQEQKLQVKEVLTTEDEQTTEIDNRIISKIQFEGLKKTKDFYAQSFLSNCLGKKISEIDTKECYTTLYACGLFSEMKIEFIDGEDEHFATMLVHVKEKITLLPLPFVSYSSSGFMGGAVLMNMNTFGTQHILNIVSIFSLTRILGIVAFAKPATKDRIGWSVSSTIGYNSNNKISSYDDNLYFDYTSFSTSESFSLSWKIGPFSLGIGPSYSYFYSPTDYVYENHSGRLNFSGSWSTKSDFNGFFLSKTTISANSIIGIESHEGFSQKYLINLSSQMPIIPRLRFTLNSTAGILFNNHISQYFGEKTTGISILPKGAVSTLTFGGTTGLECAVAKMKFGVFSLYGLYEAVCADNYYAENFTFNNGLEVGMRIYLSKIAFPAFSAGGSYNITTNKWFFAISLGMGGM